MTDSVDFILSMVLSTNYCLSNWSNMILNVNLYCWVGSSLRFCIPVFVFNILSGFISVCVVQTDLSCLFLFYFSFFTFYARGILSCIYGGYRNALLRKSGPKTRSFCRAVVLKKDEGKIKYSSKKCYSITKS